MSLSIKPNKPYRSTISPSSLYKARCPRCTWLSYWHNFSIPANLVLNQQLSRLQESYFDNKPTHALDGGMKPGTALRYKGKKTSLQIKVNGEASRWAFYGELDFLIEYHDGTYGVTDAKVSTKKDADGLVNDYSHQLHAYAFMLENPKDDEPIAIETLGLLQWRIENTLPEDAPLGFSVMHRYIPIERNDPNFQRFMENMINVIEGDFPEASPDCYDCKWLSGVNFQY